MKIQCNTDKIFFLREEKIDKTKFFGKYFL